MKRIIPTRVVETGRLARGSSGQGVGWLQSLADRATNIRAKIAGIQERLTTPFADGPPACVKGEMLFKADLSRTLTITNFPKDDANPITFVTLLVNPIFRAGETYRIPIMFRPPGVLYAHNLVVGIEAGYTTFANNALQGITPLNDYRLVMPVASGGGFVPAPNVGTIRFTTQQQVLGNFASVMPFVPFLWNIIDHKSGRQYAKDWVPHGELRNPRGGNASAAQAAYTSSDSELFEFDTPWLFERDGQVEFLFRPIMDLFQIAASDAQKPFINTSNGEGVPDLTGGRRTQQATVHVEFHGNRYYGAQDLLKDGARV